MGNERMGGVRGTENRGMRAGVEGNTNQNFPLCFPPRVRTCYPMKTPYCMDSTCRIAGRIGESTYERSAGMYIMSKLVVLFNTVARERDVVMIDYLLTMQREEKLRSWRATRDRSV